MIKQPDRYYYGLETGAVIIHERPDGTMITETWVHPSGIVWCDSHEFVDAIWHGTTSGDPLLMKIKHSYSPPNYFAYVKLRDLIKLDIVS